MQRYPAYKRKESISGIQHGENKDRNSDNKSKDFKSLDDYKKEQCKVLETIKFL